MVNKTFYWIFVSFFIWRIFLFSIAYVAPQHISFSPTFSYSEITEQSNLRPWVRRFSNFDGILYLLIARGGYGIIGSLQAFFPLFPFTLHYLGFSSVIGSIILSSLFCLMLWYIWAVFIREVLGGKYIILGMATLFLFPTSFFFTAVYTESLFLSLVLLSFLSARKGKFGLAALCATLACMTRLVGIFLVPALLFEAWQQKKHLQTYVLLCLSSLGLFGFMVFLYNKFGDAIAFFHVQSSFGAGRSTELVLYPQVVWRAIKILLTNQFNLRYLTSLSEFLAGSLGLVGLLASYDRKYLSHLIFAIPAFVLPTLTGTFSSMPRYILVCFPLFLLLTKLISTHRKIGVLWLAVSLILLIVNTMMFVQGLWVG